MKVIGLCLAVLVLVFSSVCFGEVLTWKTANQGAFAWDAVTTLADGSPLPADDGISYAVFSREVTSLVVSQGVSVTGTSGVLTFPVEGRYVLGVKAIRLSSSGGEISESVIVWTDDASACEGGQTFGYKFYSAPGAPGGLR